MLTYPVLIVFEDHIETKHVQWSVVVKDTYAATLKATKENILAVIVHDEIGHSIWCSGYVSNNKHYLVMTTSMGPPAYELYHPFRS